jgi:protoheme IX farnesyltransferase
MNTLEAPAPALPAVASLPRRRSLIAVHGRLGDYLTLAKPRLTLLVLFTVAVGFLWATYGTPDWWLLGHTLLGTALIAIGASVLNQLLERDLDARMERTRDRPLAAGRIRPQAALRLGVLTACAGIVYLALLVNPLTSFLGVATLATYLFVYTPLKRRTQFNTMVGAMAGALPPVMGWAAATGSIGVEAGTLFLLLFLWQLPHFWAIAWIYREDYRRAGLRMLSVVDESGGRFVGRLMVQHCLLLILISMGPYLMGRVRGVYLIGALLLGGLFLTAALRFLLRPSQERAREVLWASLVYLPLILTLLLIDQPDRIVIRMSGP